MCVKKETERNGIVEKNDCLNGFLSGQLLDSKAKITGSAINLLKVP